MKPRTRIPRLSKKELAKLGNKLPYSTISSPRKAVRKSNPIATKKRRARNAKRMRGKEYQEARAGAIIRSGGRCEFTEVIRERVGPLARRFGEEIRCDYEGRLQFHEEHYARGRILTADDGKMFCPPHHRLAESRKPHKWNRRAFA